MLQKGRAGLPPTSLDDHWGGGENRSSTTSVVWLLNLLLLQQSKWRPGTKPVSSSCISGIWLQQDHQDLNANRIPFTVLHMTIQTDQGVNYIVNPSPSSHGTLAKCTSFVCSHIAIVKVGPKLGRLWIAPTFLHACLYSLFRLSQRTGFEAVSPFPCGLRKPYICQRLFSRSLTSLHPQQHLNS